MSRTAEKSLVVLIVDDTEAQRYAVTRGLQVAGFHVIEAANAAEALRRAAENPDVILLDVGLPDMSGIQVCRILKEQPKTKDIPVIQTSATHWLEGLRFEPLKAGADLYLKLPIETGELVRIIHRLLRTPDKELRRTGSSAAGLGGRTASSGKILGEEKTP